MPILWAGGEDMDFMLGAGPGVVTSPTTFIRTGFTRMAVKALTNGTFARTEPFPGGPITSCWLTCQLGYNYNGQSPALLIGLVKASTLNNSGIFIAMKDVSGSGGLALYKYDGTTATLLAAGSTILFAGNTNVIQRLDLQVIGYGAACTLNLYVNNSLYTTFTGSVTVGTVTDLDAIAIGAQGNSCGMSEFVLADEDTRGLVGLVTMSPTGAGTTDTWLGSFTDVNELVCTDGTMIATNTVAQDEQFNITDMPAGSYAIKAVVVAARATSTVGAVATKLALGFRGGSGTVAVGTSQATTTNWTRITQVFAQNPVTSAAWALNEMNALQVDLQSGS